VTKKILAPTRHSDTVGGSTAARVIECPGSVELVRKVPRLPTSDYAREGTMLHVAAAAVIEQDMMPEKMLGFVHDGVELTDALMDNKLLPAISMFDAILDDLEETYGEEAQIEIESEVSFGDVIPDAFGSCDIVMRVGPRAIIADWKFGDGVPVSAVENKQLMFYARAAMHSEIGYLFNGATEVELIIIQPSQGEPSRWLTSINDLEIFEQELIRAVKESKKSTARLKQGSHCRWCSAQSICPLMTGAMERAIRLDLESVDPVKLGKVFEQTYMLETFIAKVRSLVQFAIESGYQVPGCKLVLKRATRKWKDPVDAEAMILKLLEDSNVYNPVVRKSELLSPAQMEKMLKSLKLAIPEELVVKESSGTTLALESDTRPAVTTIAVLGKSLEKLK